MTNCAHKFGNWGDTGKFLEDLPYHKGYWNWRKSSMYKLSKVKVNSGKSCTNKKSQRMLQGWSMPNTPDRKYMSKLFLWIQNRTFCYSRYKDSTNLIAKHNKDCMKSMLSRVSHKPSEKQSKENLRGSKLHAT